MILAMRSHGRSTSTTRRLGVMTAAAACTALVAGLGTGAAHAAPGDELPNDCIETSTDGGVTWTGLGAFSPEKTDYVPSPGDEGVAMEFDVRNVCDTPATLVIYSEDWEVTDGGTATVRGAIDGQEGQQFVIGPDADASERIVLKQKALDGDAGAGIAYILGIPWEETVQGNSIKPGWGFELIEAEPAAVAPEAPTGLMASETEVEVGTEVSIGGTAEPGSTVTVSGGGESCTTEAAEDGSFECSLTFTEPGDKTITATAGNDAGTSGPSDAVVVTVVEDDGEQGGGEQGGSGSFGSLGSSSGSLGSLDLFGSLGLK